MWVHHLFPQPKTCLLFVFIKTLALKSFTTIYAVKFTVHCFCLAFEQMHRNISSPL